MLDLDSKVRLTRISWIKNKLQIPICSVYSIARFLAIRIDMRKPSYTTVWSGLEIRTFGVEQIEICLKIAGLRSLTSSYCFWALYLFVWDIGDCKRAVGFHPRVRLRRPTILVDLSN